MVFTTFEYPLPNNGEGYNLTESELHDLLQQAYDKDFYHGNLKAETTVASLIKPCPWCGEMPIFRKISLDKGHGRGYPGNYEYYMECRSCGAIAPKGRCDDIYCSSDKATDAAVEAWNKRGY